jgi:hypothetical protein
VLEDSHGAGASEGSVGERQRLGRARDEGSTIVDTLCRGKATRRTTPATERSQPTASTPFRATSITVAPEPPTPTSRYGPPPSKTPSALTIRSRKLSRQFGSSYRSRAENSASKYSRWPACCELRPPASSTGTPSTAS